MVAVAQQLEESQEAWKVLEQRERERVLRALGRAEERGGLPRLLDFNVFEKRLADVTDELEHFALDAEAVDGAVDLLDVPMPFAVTAEHIAALALIADEARWRAETLKELAGRIQKTLPIIGVLPER